MPTYQITGPDGKKYRITGENPEGAFAALQQHLGRSAQQPAPAESDPRNSLMGSVDSFVRGAADTLSFGLADELAAGGDALLNPLVGTGEDGDSFSQRYEANLRQQRSTDDEDARERLASRIAGQLVGGVTGGIGLARNGLSMTANAINRGAGLVRVSGASLAEGGIMGAGQGFGTGEDGFLNRATNAGISGSIGAGLGVVAPGAVAGASKVAKGAVAPLMSRLMPETYANDAMGTYLRRSGKTPDQIADIMRFAADEGQPEYALADALGYTGQRAASTVARTPHDERQNFVNFLQRRHSGQGERLSNALAEGFGAADTAASRSAALTNARTAEANKLYAAARRDAGPVNVTPVIEAIDETLSPGINQLMSPRDRIANDSIEGALSRVRSMITDGRSNVTDFNTLFRTKLDLDDMIQRAEAQGAGNRAHYLANIQSRVDDALADASKSYAQARDTFARDSRRIEAVETGSAASSGRRRAEDTIPAFSSMTPEEQAAFRAGYADPLIARVEGGAAGPMTNKTRLLTTPKYEQEFPAFAVPDQADRLGRRIGREQRMFDTYSAALGNSKTADNMADAADMAQYDTAVMNSLLSGGITNALFTGAARAINEAKGMPPSVVERVARSIMETNPDTARQILTAGNQRNISADQLRARIIAAIMGSGTAGTGRLAAP
ncbi:MAG: hypothetical protein QHC90_25245 [Shinella sp.]|nr:hypothetical protein [Shinella sp.]